MGVTSAAVLGAAALEGVLAVPSLLAAAALASVFWLVFAT